MIRTLRLVAASSMVVLFLSSVALAEVLPPGGTFTDDNGSVHEADIEAIAAEGITKGCNPPTNDRFCPQDPVTRGQMAAFLVRPLDLTYPTDVAIVDQFVDDNGSTFENDINLLSVNGITKGCDTATELFCPNHTVTRGQMAAFLVRALALAPTATDYFTDDQGSTFEGDINALAAAGITKGCTDTRYCPNQEVTRAQMASFLTRALGLTPITPPPPTADPIPVVDVIDGDEFDVVIDGREERVRMFGIWAPEVGECFGPEASARLQELIGGGTVTLRQGFEDRDGYDRLSRKVYRNGVYINEQMVREGYARASASFDWDAGWPDGTDFNLARAVSHAQVHQVGLWAPDACVTPSADITIVTVMYDPAGDDAQAEYVRLRNDDTTTVNLALWRLWDESVSNHCDISNYNLYLTPGATIDVYAGNGTTTSDRVYCGRVAPMWNNDSGTAFLLDPGGALVDSYGW